MRKAFSAIAALLIASPGTAGEFKHAIATVGVDGTWKEDSESSEDTLILNSQPDGQQIVVSALRLKQKPEDMDQLVSVTIQLYRARMAAFMELAKGTAEFENPETEAFEDSVVVRCRAFARNDGTRMLMRVEASAVTRIIRSTSIYDYTQKSEEEFAKWSSAMLAGVK